MPCKLHGANSLNVLAATNIDPALLAQVQALFAQQKSNLAEMDFKIVALKHELAYSRQICYGKASEAPSGERRLLSNKTGDTDLSAIEKELAAQVPARR